MAEKFRSDVIRLLETIIIEHKMLVANTRNKIIVLEDYLAKIKQVQIFN